MEVDWLFRLGFGRRQYLPRILLRLLISQIKCCHAAHFLRLKMKYQRIRHINFPAFCSYVPHRNDREPAISEIEVIPRTKRTTVELASLTSKAALTIPCGLRNKVGNMVEKKCHVTVLPLYKPLIGGPLDCFWRHNKNIGLCQGVKKWCGRSRC